MHVLRSSRVSVAGRLERVRERAWPVLQTTVAAVASWYLAVLVLPEDRPFFAPVAAIVALGASYEERGRRARDMIVGVTVGAAIAVLLMAVLGTGLLQLGLLILLAMVAALLLGGGPVLVNQAAISAILLVILESGRGGPSPDRLLEALIGGGVALAVNSLLFPPNPVKMVDRALLPLVEDLARALERTAAALASGEREEARRALWSARGIDQRVDALEDAVEVGRETARFAPLRRPSLGRLDVYEEQVRHLDFAVRNTRVLARAVDRFVRRGGSAPEELPAAIRELAGAVRALGAEDDAGRSSAAARRLAALAARRAGAVLEPRRDLATSAIVSQIRSTAADLLRAADPGVDERQPSYETPTDELLAEPLASAGRLEGEKTLQQAERQQAP